MGQGALLAHAGFVLKPDFNGLPGGLGRQGVGCQACEVFLYASCAAASDFG